MLKDGDCVVGDAVAIGESLGVIVVGTSRADEGDAVMGGCDGTAVVALDVDVAEGEPVGDVVSSACIGDCVGEIVMIGGDVFKI